MTIAYTTFVKSQDGYKEGDSVAYKASGFTGNSLGLPKITSESSNEILGYGDSKSYQGLFVYNLLRKAEADEQSTCDSVFEWINATDVDNPYNINGVSKKDPKFESTVTVSTAASSGVFQSPNASGVFGNDDDDDEKRNVMHSINIVKEFP